jgi:hypothetical protein
MPDATPLVVDDLSRFARALGRALADRHAAGEAPPGHVALLNLIARAAGHRNVQALKAHAAATPPAAQQAAAAPALPAAQQAAAAPALPAAQQAAASPALPAALSDTARKALGHFDADGRLQRWPTRFSVQALVMWVLWTRFDAGRAYTEREVNAILKDAQTFGDHVTLRRELINHRLMTRRSDCSEYRKLPARADAQARALLAAWRARVRAAPPRPRVVRDEEVAPPVCCWLRMPLPYALNHINLWAIADAGRRTSGWAIVDTGTRTEDAALAVWRDLRRASPRRVHGADARLRHPHAPRPCRHGRLADAQVRRAAVDDAAGIPELPRDGRRHRPRGAARRHRFYRRAGWSEPPSRPTARASAASASTSTRCPTASGACPTATS